MTEAHELSPPQRRVWRLAAGAPDGALASVAVVVLDGGVVDRARLAAAIAAVARRYEIVRTAIVERVGAPYPRQAVHAAGEVAVVEVDVGGGGGEVEDVIVTLVEHVRAQPIDVTRAPALTAFVAAAQAMVCLRASAMFRR